LQNQIQIFAVLFRNGPFGQRVHYCPHRWANPLFLRSQPTCTPKVTVIYAVPLARNKSQGKSVKPFSGLTDLFCATTF